MRGMATVGVMTDWFMGVVLIILVVTVIAMLLRRRGGFGGFGGKPATAAAGFEQGTLTVTGISGRGAEDKNQQAYSTFTGTVLGASIPPTDIYGTLVVGAGDSELEVGQDLPVVYKPGKVTSTWRFGSLDPGPLDGGPAAPTQ